MCRFDPPKHVKASSAAQCVFFRSTSEPTSRATSLALRRRQRTKPKEAQRGRNEARQKASNLKKQFRVFHLVAGAGLRVTANGSLLQRCPVFFRARAPEDSPLRPKPSLQPSGRTVCSQPTSSLESQVFAHQILQLAKSLQGSGFGRDVARHEMTEALGLLDLQGEATSKVRPWRGPIPDGNLSKRGMLSKKAMLSKGIRFPCKSS